MPEELAEVVGIGDVKTGRGPAKTVGVGGQVVDTYFHEVEIQVQGDPRKLPIVAGFGKIEIPLLGRSFFRHFRAVIFDESKEKVELRV
jgi:hypothetical protein